MRSRKATPPQIPLLGVLVDENKKEDKHVEAFIEIFKDPASMPAPPPVVIVHSLDVRDGGFAHISGKDEENINNYFFIRLNRCA